MPAAPTPKQQLEFSIGKYTPEIAGLARQALAKLRERLPGAIEFVYDNYNALAIGFGPTERPSDAVFSVVLYPRWVLLYFLRGASLPDPARRLKGGGTIGRHLVLHDVATLDDPQVMALMDEAIAFGEIPFDPKQRRKLLIRAVAAKQRARRPA
jgi:hypothetical protein